MEPNFTQYSIFPWISPMKTSFDSTVSWLVLLASWTPLAEKKEPDSWDRTIRSYLVRHRRHCVLADFLVGCSSICFRWSEREGQAARQRLDVSVSSGLVIFSENFPFGHRLRPIFFCFFVFFCFLWPKRVSGFQNSANCLSSRLGNRLVVDSRAEFLPRFTPFFACWFYPFIF